MYSEDQIERIKRNTNLAELAASYGYAIDGKPCRTSIKMRHHGRIIIVATDEKDNHGIFFYVDGSGGGSAIDFVMKEEGINFGKACRKLEEWLNIPPVSFPTAYAPISRPEPITRDLAKVIAEWEGLQLYKPGYLESRGLSPETIAKFSGHIRTGGKYNNTYFVHEDETEVTGFEVKNRGGFHGFAPGGYKSLFLCKVGKVDEDPEPYILITESAIDAMSGYELDPKDGIYISIAGGLNPTQPEYIRRILARYPHAKIHIATDNDLPTKQHPKPDGEHYYEVIRELCPPTATVICAIPPEPYKDLNDVLMKKPRQPKKNEHGHAARIAGERSTTKEREHTP